MSKTGSPESAASGKPVAPPLAFEEALQKLEGIVEAMENEELPLESLLQRYEEGTRLAQVCQAKLSEAELKIRQLEKAPGGAVALKSFSPQSDEPGNL